ncbi:MAG: hypothetical protein P8P26_04690 [Porticoccaceae bacterium]|nr:hypothetical protein [Porticoccaceae bacterium]
MIWKEIIYPSPKLQELYRLALCLCGAIILLGAWNDIGYHPALLALLPTLVLYQLSSYFNAKSLAFSPKKQRLSLLLDFVDGILTGVLIAFVSFDLILSLALGMAFLIAIISAMKATAPLDLFGLFVGLLLTYWLSPVTIIPSHRAQLMILVVVAGYWLWLATVCCNQIWRVILTICLLNSTILFYAETNG